MFVTAKGNEAAFPLDGGGESLTDSKVNETTMFKKNIQTWTFQKLSTRGLMYNW